MARAVLAAVAAVMLVACPRREGPHPELGRAACPASLGAVSPSVAAEYQDFRATVEAGPFHRAAREDARGAISCRARVEAAAIVLEFDCPRATCLTARRDPTIEFTEQRLVLAGLTEGRAVSLLRELESTAFGAGGCGIDWSSPSVEQDGAARRVTYRGDVCNCRATVVLAPDGRNEAVFRSAC